MKETARLIIPAWGEIYVRKLLSVTLPAALAAGNLPALCQAFEVELVVVTELRFFDLISASQTFRAASKVCRPELIPLDDLLTDVAGDYGIVLTDALFRGFADLGARMTNTYLLFLNADFVVSDGSLRHIGQLMLEGKRRIHAPSFRVISENVWPQLLARVDVNTCSLSIPSREMANLALKNKHPTVRARTINQRLFHQKWMDQFYWYVDEDTLIGYQSPVALVAIKPERVVLEPVLVWDFAFIPETAPTLTPHFITDSDDFFMIEPQSRETGHEMIRIGGASMDEVASDLSLWLTKEQRVSSKQLLKIHAGDISPAIDPVIEESRAYMAEIYRRMAPIPAPHVGHPCLGEWFQAARERRRALNNPAQQKANGQALTRSIELAPSTHGQRLTVTALWALQATHRRMFGAPPEVGKFHPLWTDIAPIEQKIANWQQSGNDNILRITVDDWRRKQQAALAADLAASSDLGTSTMQDQPYDACICEVTLTDLANVVPLYAELRPVIKDDGHVVFKTVRSGNIFGRTELFLDSCNFPDVDISEIHFYGTATIGLIRALYIRAMRPVPTRPLIRALSVFALILLAPVVRLANARAARRDLMIFIRGWTDLVIEFKVKRSQRSTAKPLQTIGA